MKDVCLVVPSIRKTCIYEFMRRWANVGLFDHVDMMVVEDNPTKTFELAGLTFDDPSMHVPTLGHVSWKEIDEDLKEKSWIIPRRTDCVRSYGYYRAWRDNYKYVLTLDDDCYPCDGAADGLKYDGAGFVNEHLKALNSKTMWFNTLDSVKPRGIPFFDLGSNDRVMLNHGLWTNVLDYDAPTQLAAPKKEQLPYDNRIVPSGVHFPMCGMNVMWRAEITPLMYHLLMGQMPCLQSDASTVVDGIKQHILVKLPFDRFGDIWCGLFMKKILDHVGMNVASGMPYIHHDRASNPFTNLKKEMNGLEVNEKLWRYVDWCELGALPDDLSDPEMYPRLYAKLALGIEKYQDFPEHIEYFKLLGKAMREWASLFVRTYCDK